MAAQETALQTNSSRYKKFFREVRAEMKKVAWPNRKELMAYSAVVLVSVITVAFVIWVIDDSFTYVIRTLIK